MNSEQNCYGGNDDLLPALKETKKFKIRKVLLR